MRHTLYQTQFCVRKLRHGEDKLLAKATHLINGTYTRPCIAAVCFLKGNYLLDLSIFPLTRRKMDRYRNCEFSAGEYEMCIKSLNMFLFEPGPRNGHVEACFFFSMGDFWRCCFRKTLCFCSPSLVNLSLV